MPRTLAQENSDDLDIVDIAWPRLGDAVDEAIGRITVVLRLMNDHDCMPDPAKASDPENDGGYDLTIAVDALRHVRDLLQRARAQHPGGNAS